MTGGAGYVGSACLRWMAERGHDVFAYDDLSAGNRAAVPADRLIQGDIRDRAALVAALKATGAECVMHYAALASVPESIREPDRYWDINVHGTQCVLDAMHRCDVRRFVFSSTAATYAFDAEMPLTDASAQIPETPYGTTKLAAERMIRDYATGLGLGAVILRYFNASGADASGEHGESRSHETHLIPLILSVAAGARESVTIFGTDWPTPDGTCVRDYVHVADLASAHEAAAKAIEPGAVEAFNVGTGRGTSVMEVLRACERVSGHSINHVLADRRDGDPPTLVASPQRLIDRLGWTPAHPTIDSIVETAWAWHRAFPAGYPADGA
ncbi:MAG: UDP-glucose 4-epimerase GalE [Phycisphaerales bacterium]